jgi:hypothetical protein
MQTHQLVQLREHHSRPETRDGPQLVESRGHPFTFYESFQIGIPVPLQTGPPLRFETGPLLNAVLPDLAEQLAIAGPLVDKLLGEPYLQVRMEVWHTC